MHHLKQNAGPILTGPTGAPVWPDGYCGSLSHTTHHVAAIIALATRYDSVGVDIDDKRPLGSAVRDVATIAELEIVDAMVQDGATSAECLIFSVKEAIFKCQYPLTKDESLDFLDIRLVRGDRPNTLKFRVTDQERTLLTQLAPHIQLHSYNIQGVTTVCAVLPKQ
jgi:4'-phosphopantetheinyl transferase EntD